MSMTARRLRAAAGAAALSPLALLAATQPAAAQAVIARSAESPIVVLARSVDPNIPPSESGQTREPATPIVTAYPAEAAGDGNASAGYNLSRWAEDWTKYRNPKKRDDFLDRLKYLPLDDDGDVYVTLSGEARVRFNLTTNPGLRKAPHQRQDILRLVGGADVHVGKHLRFYGEIAHGGLDGQNLGTPAATLRNDLVLQQGFAELHGEVGGLTVGGRYGRQEFTDGPNLLVSQRDNNTIRFVLNGARGWVRGKTLRLDAFDFKMTRFGDGGLGDDKVDDGRRFSGVTGGVVIPRDWFGGSKLYLDPFVWRLRTDAATWGATTAREARNYVGARLWGDVGRLTIDWSANHQSGDFDGREIDATQVLMAQTWRLGAASTAPRIGVHADYASGGGGANGQGKLRTAFAPFGNNIYYSYALFLTPTNLKAIAPNFTFQPIKGVRTTLEYQWTWRANANDAVYRANGTALPGTAAVPGTKVADVARAQVVWSISPRLSATMRLEYLRADDVLKRAGLRDSAFAAGWLSFRF